MKTPKEFTLEEWVDYFIGALRREAEPQYNPRSYFKAHLITEFANLNHQGINPWVLAIAIDNVAVKWNEFKFKAPWELVTWNQINKPFREKELPNFFWRTVWFSRYWQTVEEVNSYKKWFFKYWLAISNKRGETGRDTLLFDSICALQKIEEKIIIREVPEPASFLWHWVRLYL